MYHQDVGANATACHAGVPRHRDRHRRDRRHRDRHRRDRRHRDRHRATGDIATGTAATGTAETATRYREGATRRSDRYDERDGGCNRTPNRL